MDGKNDSLMVRVDHVKERMDKLGERIDMVEQGIMDCEDKVAVYKI